MFPSSSGEESVLATEGNQLFDQQREQRNLQKIIVAAMKNILQELQELKMAYM